MIRQCAWCNNFNEYHGVPIVCVSCGHRGDAPKSQCNCRQCRQPAAVVQPTIQRQWLFTCPWCGGLCDKPTPAFCESCGHRADIPQKSCTCAACSTETAAPARPTRQAAPSSQMRVCAWCQTYNEFHGSSVYCSGCGHRADAPKNQCDCRKCTQPVPAVTQAQPVRQWLFTCQWCGQLCDKASPAFCDNCGHRADVPQKTCDCSNCQQHIETPIARSTRSAPSVQMRCCPWCQSFTPFHGAAISCASCGHRADVPKDQCDCRNCMKTTVNVPVTPAAPRQWLRACPWCRALNDFKEPAICETCGHRFDVPKQSCNCSKCKIESAAPAKSTGTQMRTCPHCHSYNEYHGTPILCGGCGHRSDIPKDQCDCKKCKTVVWQSTPKQEQREWLRGCPWCDTLVNATAQPPNCSQCGHRFDLPKKSCDCVKCTAAASTSAPARSANAAPQIRTCPWCQGFNDYHGAPIFCRNCGHRADVPREHCNCRAHTQGAPKASIGITCGCRALEAWACARAAAMQAGATKVTTVVCGCQCHQPGFRRIDESQAELEPYTPIWKKVQL